MRFPIAAPDGSVPWWSRPFGVRPERSWVEIGDGRLTARFGPWTTTTPVGNVTDVRTAGPYSWWKVAGPARGSLADRSLTLATRTDVGVEITFAAPIRGLDPWGRARHPSLTVTPADPQAFVDALRTAARLSG